MPHIPGFHVIDCEENILVPFSEDVLDFGYATLSYVWGLETTSPALSSGSPLPKTVPLVVSDAITVCKQLGLRYIWIDRYCILQDTQEDAHAQIQSMNHIYKHSDLTIIAAAGSDPYYGLPGVSTRARLRPLRPPLHIGDQTLIPLPFKSQIDGSNSGYAESKWNTRGWTYQEAVLSRRRLVFTDTQVFFQCLNSRWQENLSLSLPTGPPSEQGPLAQLFPHGPVGLSNWDFGTHVTRYFGRELTYSSDALNAFLGILREFQEGSAGLKNLVGVPIYRHKQPIIGFLVGLCWDIRLPTASRHLLTEDGLDMNWSPFSWLKQDGLFPSWSWLGWK
ncbi:heterokaryon incompatibility protein-domain-containing protein, partial [Podospora australis]